MAGSKRPSHLKRMVSFIIAAYGVLFEYGSLSFNRRNILVKVIGIRSFLVNIHCWPNTVYAWWLRTTSWILPRNKRPLFKTCCVAYYLFENFLVDSNYIIANRFYSFDCSQIIEMLVFAQIILYTLNSTWRNHDRWGQQPTIYRKRIKF